MAQQLLLEGAAPATPGTGYVTVYAKADGVLYSKDDAGVESTAASPVAGAGLTKIGNTLDAVGTAGRIVVATDSIDIGTDVVTLLGTQTLTNKTLVAPALGTPASGVATNLTGTAAGLTAGAANGLKSATTTVSVSAATAPTSGQVLTATAGTTATWQTPASSGLETNFLLMGA